VNKFDETFKVIKDTKDFWLLLDTEHDPIDLDHPAYYIVHKENETVEYATNSLINAHSYLRTIQEMYNTVLNPPEAVFVQPEDTDQKPH